MVAYQVVEIEDVAGGLLYYVAQSFLLAGSIFGLDQYLGIIKKYYHENPNEYPPSLGPATLSASDTTADCISVLFVFLDEGVGLGVAEVLGFGKILDTFSLVAFEALGKAFEEVAVAVVAVKFDALVGCLDGLFVHADSYLKG